MLSVAAAQALVLQHARPLPAERASLAATVLNQVLAEDVASDLDMPPFDKAMMDGYALRCADLVEGRVKLRVIEEITAGKTPLHPLGAGQAARIMTGAPVPAGANAVVMVERCRLLEDAEVQVDDPSLRPGKNIMPRGQEMRRGQVVLKSGAVLRPQELALLATVGRTTAKIIPQPRVAIFSTGDEIVDASQVPGAGQIRNSNGPMLAAQVCRGGGVPRCLGAARDRLESLRPLVAEGLEAAILILSGGVSVGKLDLVPGVLEELGVQPHFHKVAMKPGKPVYFGIREASARTPSPCLVFALPGNPVSAFVCFELFVGPAIRRLGGHANPGPRLVQAALAEDFVYHTDRPTYHPARLEETEQGRRVRPLSWLGSADLRALTEANAFVIFPEGDHRHRAGQSFQVLVPRGGRGEW